MKNTEIIDNAINDLMNPSIKLSEVLFKIQVIAIKIDNIELKEWTKNEIIGYNIESNNIPNYRKVMGIIPFADLFHRTDKQENNKVPLEAGMLPTELQDEINRMTTCIFYKGVSGLEVIASKGKTMMSPLSVSFFDLFIKHEVYSSQWGAIQMYQIIPIEFYTETLTKIKFQLLNFLVKIQQEIGGEINIPLPQKTEKIDDIFKNTIGSFSTSGNVNITFINGHGNNSSQAITMEYKEI